MLLVLVLIDFGNSFIWFCHVATCTYVLVVLHGICESHYETLDDILQGKIYAKYLLLYYVYTCNLLGKYDPLTSYGNVYIILLNG